MTRGRYLRYFQVLEVPPEASLQEVKRAYNRLHRIYSGHAPLLAPITSDFPEEKRKAVLVELEEAYQKILEFFGERTDEMEPAAPPRKADDQKKQALPKSEARGGALLRETRERLGVSLEEIREKMKLRLEQLANIEAENFSALPDEVYLKAQLREYASLLSLNPDAVAGDYLARYREWKAVRTRRS